MRAWVSLFIAISMLTVATTHAETFDTRLARECPATDAWMQAHASSSEHDKALPARGAKRHYSEPSLRKELAERYAKDQQVRTAWVADNYSNTAGKALKSVDAGNLAWLKTLVSQHGFPTVKQVGKEGIEDAWMLVQHATADPAFQTRVLRKLTTLMKAGAISKQDYALLDDRVQVEQGKPQIFGTQFYVPNDKNGKPISNADGTLDLRMRALEDPRHVDQRRASMGLMPLMDYKCMLRVMYTPSDRTGHGTGKAGK